MNEWEVKYNVKKRRYCFYLNVSILDVVCPQKISINRQFQGKIAGILKFVGEIQQLARKRLQKTN